MPGVLASPSPPTAMVRALSSSEVGMRVTAVQRIFGEKIVIPRRIRGLEGQGDVRALAAYTSVRGDV